MFEAHVAHDDAVQVRPGGEPRAVGAKDDKMLRLQLEVTLLQLFRDDEIRGAVIFVVVFFL